MIVKFTVPCLVRARSGRGRTLETFVTTADVDFDVPEIHEGDATMSYAAELGRRADGYTQFYGYGGQFYTGTLVFDGDASREGWPEDPWRPTSALYRRLWLALAEELFKRSDAALRAAPFDHPAYYSVERSNARVEAFNFYFAVEDRESMLAFLEDSGVKVVGPVPRSSRLRWATHDWTIDGLELDRVARVALHETSLAFASTTLLREQRGFFDAFYDLKEFLDRRHDLEETAEELFTKLLALFEKSAANPGVSEGLINRPLKDYLDRAIRRFGDRRITPMDFLPSAGSLPQPR